MKYVNLILQGLCQWMGASPEDRLLYLEDLLGQVDVGRIRSWRGMSDRLAAYFSSDYQAPVTAWAETMSPTRDTIDSKLPLKGEILEVSICLSLFLIYSDLKA